MDLTAAVALAAGLGGAIVAPFLTLHGLSQLRWNGRLKPWFRTAVGIVGAAVSIAIVLFADEQAAAQLTLQVWGCSLVATAGCDALTQRIPSALVRQSTMIVALLLVGGGLVNGSWQPVFHSAVWAGAAGAALFVAYRFAGAGAGDVRLAVLGGLGLFSATASGVLVGIALWGGVTAVETVVSLTRGGSLRTQVALGPGLAAGFLVAALAPV